MHQKQSKNQWQITKSILFLFINTKKSLLEKITASTHIYFWKKQKVLRVDNIKSHRIHLKTVIKMRIMTHLHWAPLIYVER